MSDPNTLPEVIDSHDQQGEVLVGLTNIDLTLDEMERTRFDEGRYLTAYLDQEPNADENPLFADFNLMLTFVRVVIRNEGLNDDYLPVLRALEADVVRCKELSAQGQPAELTPRNQETFLLIFNSLKEHKDVMADTTGQLEQVIDDVGNTAAGLLTQVRENSARLSDTQQSVLLAGAFAGIILMYTSKGKLAGALRTAVNYGGVGLLAGYFLNAGSTMLTGEGILGNLQRLNRRNNDQIAAYFGADPDLPSERLAIDALVDSATIEDQLARNTSFSTMISSYNPNSESLPDYIYNGTTSFDTPDKRQALHAAVGMVYRKFGPGSTLNAPGSEIERRWNFAMENDAVGWGQGLFSLLALDSNAPDFYPTYTESVMDFIGYRAELIASPVITWSMNTFDEIVRNMPGEALGLLEALRRLFPGGVPEDGRLKDFLDLQISSPEELAMLGGNYGRFAYAALNSNNPNNIFEDGTGTAYTTVNVPIINPNVANHAVYHLRLADAYVTAFRRFKQEYPDDTDIADHVNILFGARHVTASGGTYSVAFTYTPEGSTARDNALLQPRGLDAGLAFGFTNTFTPAEKFYAMAFYQCDEDTFVNEYEPEILANLPAHVDTTREKFEYIFDQDNRTRFLQSKGVTFDVAAWDLYVDLEEKNQQYANTLPTAEQISLFYNAVATMHSIYYNKDTRHLVGLNATSSNEEVLEAYDVFLQRYITEFKFTNFGNLTLLTGNADPDVTPTLSRLQNSDLDFEIATKEYLNALCDLDRTSPPDDLPESTWRFEYFSTEQSPGSASVQSLEMLPNSALFLGAGTTIQCDNSIIYDWYASKNYVTSPLPGTAASSTQLVGDRENYTFTVTEDLILAAGSDGTTLEKGVRISGKIYYFMQH